MPEDQEWDIAEENEASDYREELTIDRVKKAIEELPDGYRSVLSLYLIEGYDHQEIAGIMGISESTSKSSNHEGPAQRVCSKEQGSFRRSRAVCESLEQN